MHTAPRAQFDGPGNRWSPETLLMASIADCFVLTFRAVSRVTRLPWLDVEGRVEGVLERVDGIAQFTRYTTRVMLTVPSGVDEASARRLLEKEWHAPTPADSGALRREKRNCSPTPSSRGRS